MEAIEAIDKRKFEDMYDIACSYEVLFYQYMSLRHMRNLVLSTQDFMHEYNEKLCKHLTFCTIRLRKMERYIKDSGKIVDFYAIQDKVIKSIYLQDYRPKIEDTLTYKFKHLTNEKGKN